MIWGLIQTNSQKELTDFWINIVWHGVKLCLWYWNEFPNLDFGLHLQIATTLATFAIKWFHNTFNCWSHFNSLLTFETLFILLFWFSFTSIHNSLAMWHLLVLGTTHPQSALVVWHVWYDIDHHPTTVVTQVWFPTFVSTNLLGTRVHFFRCGMRHHQTVGKQISPDMNCWFQSMVHRINTWQLWYEKRHN